MQILQFEYYYTFESSGSFFKNFLGKGEGIKKESKFHVKWFFFSFLGIQKEENLMES